MSGRQHARAATLATLGAALLARLLVERGGARRVASLVLHRLRYGRRRDGAAEQSRLYARGRRRLEAHVGRRASGACVVLALPVDGSGRTAVYTVDEGRPWQDFERQAGLVGAAWGPCRDASAGL